MAQFQTGYMDRALDDLAGLIEDAKVRLGNVDFDTIVGTGFSGGAVVPALALSMGKNYVLVRKENDNSHHGPGRLLGNLGERWIFVDDMTASGDTRNYVFRKISHASTRKCTENACESNAWMPRYEDIPIRSTFVGDYFYNYLQFNPADPSDFEIPDSLRGDTQ